MKEEEEEEKSRNLITISYTPSSNKIRIMFYKHDKRDIELKRKKNENIIKQE